MEKPILSDKDIFPSGKVIFSHIKRSRTLWESLFEYIKTEYPDISREWRYYLDGKRWLLKVTRKSKTMFWLSLVDHSFRTTFYFNHKAERLIRESNIPDRLKEQFLGKDRSRKIHGITIVFKNKKDVEYAKKLLEIKLKIK
ncbi:MAG: DUF3788 family protein [bacterium]|nr:DUF3788 family protein [bacterium]